MLTSKELIENFESCGCKIALADGTFVDCIKGKNLCKPCRYKLEAYKKMQKACLKEIDEIIKICELLKNSKHEKWLHINITLKELKQRIKEK